VTSILRFLFAHPRHLFRQSKHFYLAYDASYAAVSSLLIIAALLSSTTPLFGSPRLYWLAIAPCAVYGAIVAHLCLHNAVHGNFPRAINRVLGEVLGFIVVVRFASWVMVHLRHHRYSDDRALDPHPNFSSFWVTVKHTVVQVEVQLQQEYYERWGDTPENRAAERFRARISYGTNILVIAFWYLLLGPWFFFLVFAPANLLGALFIIHFNWVTHNGLRGSDFKPVNLNRGYYWLGNKIFAGIYMHANHHRRPHLFNPSVWDPAKLGPQAHVDRATAPIRALLALLFFLIPATAHAVEVVGDTGFVKKVDVFGRFFIRPDVRNNDTDFNSAASDTGFYFALRGNLGVAVSLPLDVRAVINLQNYGFYSLKLGPLDDTVRLYEAFVELRNIGGTPFSYQIGRIELGKYGTELLIGNRDFDQGFSFESWRLRYEVEHIRSDWMWVQQYQTVGTEMSPVLKHPVVLMTYNTFNLLDELSLDAYFIALIARHFEGFQTTTLTAGGRAFGNVDQLDYTAELAYQFGPATRDDGMGTGHVRAYAFEARAGYRLVDLPLRPRIAASFYRASGDHDPSDSVVGSFNLLWQNDHARFGNADRFLGSNLQVIKGTLSVDLAEANGDTVLGANGYYATVPEVLDRSNGVLDTTLAPTLRADASHYLGWGADVFLNYNYSPNMLIAVDGSVFVPGDYIHDNIGAKSVVLRTYAHFEVRF
jgi:stearoyl-CoA desaturase (delta-9 desaturase)